MLVRNGPYLPALLLTIAPLLQIANPQALSSHNTHTQNAFNLTSATADLQPNIHNHHSSLMTTLAPRFLSRNDLINSWNLIFNNYQAFSPSSSSSAFAATALSNIYTSIFSTLALNQSAITPEEILSFTYSNLRCSIQAIGQAVPWGVLQEVLNIMMGVTRAGLVGLYTVAFYYLKGSIAWSIAVVVVIVVANVGEKVTQNIIL